jgi:hypothetical protein
MNGKGRDKGISDKGRDDGDSRSEAQLFTCIIRGQLR